MEAVLFAFPGFAALIERRVFHHLAGQLGVGLGHDVETETRSAEQFRAAFLAGFEGLEPAGFGVAPLPLHIAQRAADAAAGLDAGFHAGRLARARRGGPASAVAPRPPCQPGMAPVKLIGAVGVGVDFAGDDMQRGVLPAVMADKNRHGVAHAERGERLAASVFHFRPRRPQRRPVERQMNARQFARPRLAALMERGKLHHPARPLGGGLVVDRETKTRSADPAEAGPRPVRAHGFGDAAGKGNGGAYRQGAARPSPGHSPMIRANTALISRHSARNSGTSSSSPVTFKWCAIWFMFTPSARTCSHSATASG